MSFAPLPAVPLLPALPAAVPLLPALPAAVPLLPALPEVLLQVADPTDLAGQVAGGPVGPVAASLPNVFDGWLEGAVRRATGWPGLVIIFVYSFLIAFILPGVSEVVLLAPLDLGLPYAARLAVIIVTSGVGKAAGSVLAFHIGQEAKQAGPVVRALRRSRFDVMEWSEKRAVALAQRYGYMGLALALSVPFFPDTISVYAFAVLEEDYVRFAVATFVGSVGRLLVTLGLAGGVLAVV